MDYRQGARTTLRKQACHCRVPPDKQAYRQLAFGNNPCGAVSRVVRLAQVAQLLAPYLVRSTGRVPAPAAPIAVVESSRSSRPPRISDCVCRSVPAVQNAEHFKANGRSLTAARKRRGRVRDDNGLCAARGGVFDAIFECGGVRKHRQSVCATGEHTHSLARAATLTACGQRVRGRTSKNRTLGDEGCGTEFCFKTPNAGCFQLVCPVLLFPCHR